MTNIQSILIIGAISIMTFIVVTLIGARNGHRNMKNVTPFLGNEGPLSSSSEETRSIKDLPVVPVKAPRAAGGFAILLTREPTYDRFSSGLLGDDRFLDIRIQGDEWAALFLDVLKCPDVQDIPRFKDESDDDWLDRYGAKFSQRIPEYPMLGRIYDTFIYAAFSREEVDELRNECLTLEKITSDTTASSMLQKLSQACDEAAKRSDGLFLVPD